MTGLVAFGWLRLLEVCVVVKFAGRLFVDVSRMAREKLK
jgi:hypothetical protein